MQNELIQNRIHEIVEWAAENDNSISRRMVNDIAREKNTGISDVELEEIIYSI